MPSFSSMCFEPRSARRQVCVPITPRSWPCVSDERSVSTSWMSVDRVESNEPVLGLAYVELDEPPSFDILAHHRFGHIAPADAFLQQHVLRAEIGQAPGLRADHSEILALRERRAISKHKLDVVRSRRVERTRPWTRVCRAGRAALLRYPRAPSVRAYSPSRCLPSAACASSRDRPGARSACRSLRDLGPA